jgi:hypothetical protein
LEQLVTLAIFKSTSGTIKKMLHGPTLRIYCVKEVPLANRNMREILKEIDGKSCARPNSTYACMKLFGIVPKDVFQLSTILQQMAVLPTS